MKVRPVVRDIGIAVAVCALIPAALDSARVRADEITCSTCHVQQAEELGTSVHHALSCQTCHGGDGSYELAAEELKRFATGAAAGGLRFDHGAKFTGKADRRSVPERCGTCHADVERMNPYGLRTDQLARYWTSTHGKALREKNDDRVAVCVDCHGSHAVLPAMEPNSLTYPKNVPQTCGRCHADAALMQQYDLPAAIVDEYRQSVHGKLLLDMGDTGSPTCATCHGNHSSIPPGFASVGAVCGRCHQHAAINFSKSIHSGLREFRGCVSCHGGGEGRRFHLIERITKPTGVLIQRYAHLLRTRPQPTESQVAEAIHPDARQIIERALPTCTECHEDIEDDESLPKLLDLIDGIGVAEGQYVQTARRLNEVGRGVLLVDAQRFAFEDAKTHLIQLAPLQHTLDNALVAAKVTELEAVCDKVNADLDRLEGGLRWRRRALIPIWLFAVVFAGACYVKYKRLRAIHVKPLTADSTGSHKP